MPQFIKTFEMEPSFQTERQAILAHISKIQLSSVPRSDETLLSLFRFQCKYNAIYRQYCQNLGINFDTIQHPDAIPHLPITAFKHHEVKTGEFETEEIFLSSGTTQVLRSRHFIRNMQWYLENTSAIWSSSFGRVQDYCFLALLPGYLERDGSSLISMVHHFIQQSQYTESGFYLRNHEALYKRLLHCQKSKIPVVLFGVAYALLDFTSEYSIDFPELIIMETGGMKGQRKELTKSELHHILQQKTGSARIYSEYGMTELLSQAYTFGETKFRPNPMLTVHTRQVNDPLSREKNGKSGIICVTDLANVDSCAFIQTEDQGIVHDDGTFEITGRLDASEWRGCNLLLEELGID